MLPQPPCLLAQTAKGAGVLAHVASTNGHVAAPHQHLAFDLLCSALSS
jgi:hypothetical protein